MKIIVQAYDFGKVGGIARYLESFMANVPCVEDYIVLTSTDRSEIVREKNTIKVPMKKGIFGSLFWGLKCKKIVSQLYSDKVADTVVIHMPPIIPALFKPKHIKRIITAHTTYYGETGDFYKKKYFDSERSYLERKIRYIIEKNVFKKADKIITLTEQGKQELLTYGVMKDKIKIIPNGVDSKKFLDNKKITKDIDVLFAGRLTPRKGSKAIIPAVKQMIEDLPQIKICVVGFGDDYNFLKDQLKAFSNIKFAGKVRPEKIKEYYARSKIYVSTAYYEGLPSTCLEAMSLKLPVVVWKFPFYEKLVIQNKTGFLCEPNNFEELSKQTKKLISNMSLRDKMGSAAQKNVVEQYSWENLSKNLDKQFRNIK